uniref:Uncharacterized protein n=1 Tax=Arundo donax TaxID=35708 RepID=A0A0A9EG78_ARUDO
MPKSLRISAALLAGNRSGLIPIQDPCGCRLFRLSA